MGRIVIDTTTLALAMALVAAAPRTSHGQMRRSPGPDGAGAGAAAGLKGIPRNARSPYAGVWDGAMVLTGGPADGARVPRTIVFDLADSTKHTYSGGTMLPNGQRAPHEETMVTNGEMHWKMPNSGGGFWVYAVRLVARDSIAGTVALKDWPQLAPGDKAPSGTIALVRRAP